MYKNWMFKEVIKIETQMDEMMIKTGVSQKTMDITLKIYRAKSAVCLEENHINLFRELEVNI